MYGIHGGEVQFSDSDNIIRYNTGGINLTLFDGAGTLVQDNNCGTIKIDRSSDNIIIGNTMNRVRVLGFGEENPASGNRIGGPESADRNFITGYGSWNSEGLPSGMAIQLADAANTVIENNWIGTTTDGLEKGNSACTQGISFEGYNQNTLIKNNRIAGILGEGRNPHWAGYVFGWAINIGGSGSGITITGNTVGLNANDEPVLGSVRGIDVGDDRASQVEDITIENNVIAGHRIQGIVVGHNVPQARISANSIYENDDLGIDLVTTNYATGVTENDPLDEDDGGNGLQNFPEITDTLSDGLNVNLFGVLHSYPNSEFTIEFFASPELDLSGYGEGRQYIGSTSVITDVSGNGEFETSFAVSVDPTWIATATATLEPLGATSEFSAGVNFTELVSDLDEGDILPDEMRLIGAYPNPFNPQTTIHYQLPAAGHLKIEVYDVLGRRVRTLLNGMQAAGEQRITWNGRDDSGNILPSGLYIARLNYGKTFHSIKLMLLK